MTTGIEGDQVKLPAEFQDSITGIIATYNLEAIAAIVRYCVKVVDESEEDTADAGQLILKAFGLDDE